MAPHYILVTSNYMTMKEKHQNDLKNGTPNTFLSNRMKLKKKKKKLIKNCLVFNSIEYLAFSSNMFLLQKSNVVTSRKVINSSV